MVNLKVAIKIEIYCGFIALIDGEVDQWTH